ncbi:MAG: magnesium transporter [Paraglaciecola sp.]|uniref:magnesium transporter n=1 Tax=Pseudomonadati TaxID=3379134 RepID=UPI00273F4649|nr:magnesium transporter [Paraglaciecola sp.]MDP5030145.1 magnesium transporter [Paraglaciecola sp.]MDP5130442.1 magnesium transporter [Paraglaciecola sp.]
MVNQEQRESAFLWTLDALKNEEIAVPIIAREFTPEDWAFIFEGLPKVLRFDLWQTLTEDKKAPILAAMRDDSREQLISLLSPQQLEDVVSSSSAEHLVEILDVLPNRIAKGLIKKLNSEESGRVQAALNYDDSQLGRYINHDVYTVNKRVNVSELLAEIKETLLPPYTDSILVVDEANHYLGQIDLNNLFKSSQDVSVMQLAEFSDRILSADLDLYDAADAVKSSGVSMLPVLSKDGRLIGRFTLKDAIDVFQEYYEAQVSHMGKVSDEDLFAPVFTSSRRRAVWLGINLVTAFAASIVIGVFDAVVAQVVALAVLMPIVASMGGITGSQTLTLTIRGLATGQLASSNLRALGNKEVLVAFFNGLLWATVVCVITSFWFENPWLSAIIAVSLVINMIVAAFAGIAIPVFLDKIGVDPALAGSVILTTVTDVIGFFIFLGSASLLLI